MGKSLTKDKIERLNQYYILGVSILPNTDSIFSLTIGLLHVSVITKATGY